MIKPEDCWPENVCPIKDLPIEFSFKEKLVNIISVSFGENTVTNLLLEHFSSHHPLLTETAWLLRFKSYLMTKVYSSQSHFLMISELKRAETCLIISNFSSPAEVRETVGKECLLSIKMLHHILVDDVIL